MASCKKDLFSGLFILGFSIFIALSSFKLGIGTINDPGPGFFPLLSAVLLFLLSCLLSFRFFREEISHDASKKNVRFGKIIFIIVGLIGYSLLLDSIGFFFITFLFMSVLFLMESRKAFVSALLGGIVVTISVYILFELFLGVHFPKGILGFWVK